MDPIYTVKVQGTEYEIADKASRDRLEKVEDELGQVGATAIEGLQDALQTANDNIATLTGEVDTLIGEDADKSVRTIAAEELAKELVPENAKEALDTIAEIAAWIQSHPDDASAMNAKITANETAISGLETNQNTMQEDLTAIIAKVTTLVGGNAGKSAYEIATIALTEALIPEGAKESLDTLQEIAQWIQDHPDDAAAMNEKITELTTSLSELSGKIGDLSTLTTTAKTDLVSAINEAAASGGSSGGDPNALAMLWGKDYDGNRTSTVTYNSDGNVSSISETGDGNTATRTYTYDSDGRITKEAVTGTTPDGSYTKTKELTYGDNGATKVVETYSKTLSDPTWAEIASEVQSGIAEVKYKVGDLLSDTWNNGASTYTYPWRVMGFRDVELEDGSTKRAMILMAEYTDGYTKHFNEYEAFYYAENGLSAGTYTMTVNGTDMSFTLTEDVPAGGRLAPNTSGSFASNCRSYDADGVTLLENFTMASGTDGTDLGDIVSGYIPIGNINGYGCAYYGLGRWSQSTIRMWLNSTADKGQWFDKTKKFATPPSWLSSYKGYLGGLPEDLQSVILPIKVTTYPASSISSSTPDITYDKVWLPSLEEMYISPQINGEGDSLAYYKALNGTSTKWSRSSTHAELKKYSASSHSSAQSYWTRSAYRDGARDEWYVYSSGNVASSAAANLSCAAAPLVAIG